MVFKLGLVGLSLAVLGLAACRPERSGSPTTVVDPSVFSVYVVTPKPSANATIRLSLSDGREVYRGTTPGFDARHIDPQSVFTYLSLETGESAVGFDLKEEHVRTIQAWSRAQIGKSVVYMWNNVPVTKVLPVDCEFLSRMHVRVCSEKQAEGIAADLRSMGP